MERHPWNAQVHQAFEAGIPEAVVQAMAESREADLGDETGQAFCRQAPEEHFAPEAGLPHPRTPRPTTAAFDSANGRSPEDAP